MCRPDIFCLPWATFDEDGKLDAVVSINNSVAVLIGNGNGTFQPPTNRSSLVAGK